MRNLALMFECIEQIAGVHDGDYRQGQILGVVVDLDEFQQYVAGQLEDKLGTGRWFDFH
jgi:hypothetical protein